MIKNSSEQLESIYNQDVDSIKGSYKQNKEKVIDFLLDNLMQVDLSLPLNIKKGKKAEIN